MEDGIDPCIGAPTSKGALPAAAIEGPIPYVMFDMLAGGRGTSLKPASPTGSMRAVASSGAETSLTSDRGLRGSAYISAGVSICIPEKSNVVGTTFSLDAWLLGSPFWGKASLTDFWKVTSEVRLSSLSGITNSSSSSMGLTCHC